MSAFQNLEQKRAAAAVHFWSLPKNRNANEGDEGGKVVEKLPAMIINHGLLATAAFARSKSKWNEQTELFETSPYEKLMIAVFEHLSAPEVGSMAPPMLRRSPDENEFDLHLRVLLEGDSLQLQRATAEALAFLGFLKRLAPKSPPGSSRPASQLTQRKGSEALGDVKP